MCSVFSCMHGTYKHFLTVRPGRNFEVATFHAVTVKNVEKFLLEIRGVAMFYNRL